MSVITSPDSSRDVVISSFKRSLPAVQRGDYELSRDCKGTLIPRLSRGATSSWDSSVDRVRAHYRFIFNIVSYLRRKIN